MAVSRPDSLRGLLAAIEPSLPPALADAAARERLLELGARLPFMTSVGFECHLGSNGASTSARRASGAHGSKRVDLLTSASDHPTLVAMLDGTTLGRALVDAPSRDLIDRWTDAILFEFDLDERGDEAPAVFLNVRPGAIVDGPVLLQLAACLVDGLPPGTARWLDTCVEAAAGACAEITHLGTMSSRPERPIRVNVGAHHPHALRDFVEAMPWTERRSAVHALVDFAAPLAHHLVLAVDVADGLGPAIGLECYMGAASPDGDPWRLFLHELARRDLCEPAEVDALLQWPGRTLDPPPETVPAARRHIAEFLGRDYTSAVLRRVNHVKLVSVPGAPWHAKAYLLAEHSWIERPS
jgi:hypothetical protein